MEVLFLPPDEGEGMLACHSIMVNGPTAVLSHAWPLSLAPRTVILLHALRWYKDIVWHLDLTSLGSKDGPEKLARRGEAIVLSRRFRRERVDTVGSGPCPFLLLASSDN